jgi:MFS transporter, ACS family, glucarate transporter
VTESAAAAPAPAPRLRVRWKIFLFLFGVGFVAYVQQRSISVAALPMMPDLALSQVQISWLIDAGLLGYTVMQFPGGMLGQRLGARRAFVVIGLIAVAACLVTPLAPYLVPPGALFAVLLLGQLIAGGAQAPIFPISAGVFESWFTPNRWPLVQGLQSLGLGLGASLTPLLIAKLMTEFDWRRAIVWTTLPALLLIAGWAWYGRNSPAEHPRVTAAELAELGPQPPPRAAQGISRARVWALLTNFDVVVLTLSYFCFNYVYYLLATWCFLYLVQERHFGVLEGGWLASVPPLAAAVGAGVGGWLASELGERYGIRRGLRLLPLISLPAAALLQYLAVDAANAYLAVAALALCFACIEVNEGPYWAAIMHVGRADTMAASGLLNTGGNAGGLLTTPLVGYLTQQHYWTLTFLIGTGCALAAAAGWLLVDPMRRAHA